MAHRQLRHFTFKHLRPDLQPISERFSDLAHWLAREVPENDDSREAMKWLLVAKDFAVRAQLDGTSDAG